MRDKSDFLPICRSLLSVHPNKNDFLFRILMKTCSYNQSIWEDSISRHLERRSIDIALEKRKHGPGQLRLRHGIFLQVDPGLVSSLPVLYCIFGIRLLLVQVVFPVVIHYRESCSIYGFYFQNCKTKMPITTK